MDRYLDRYLDRYFVGILIGISIGIWVGIWIGILIGTLIGILLGILIGISIGVWVPPRRPDFRHESVPAQCSLVRNGYSNLVHFCDPYMRVLGSEANDQKAENL